MAAFRGMLGQAAWGPASILRSVSHSMRARAWSPKGVSGFGRRFGYPDDSGVLWTKVGGVDGPSGWSEV